MLGKQTSFHHRVNRWRAYVAGAATIALVGLTGVSGAPTADAATYTGCRWGSSQLRFNVDNTSQTARDAINQASGNYTTNTSAKITNISTYSAWAAQNADFGPNGLHGEARWKCDGNNITYESQTYLNNYYMSGKPVAQLRVVWLHEMGHSLGLGHSTSTGDVMYECPSCAYSAGTRYLSLDERNAINYLYYGR